MASTVHGYFSRVFQPERIANEHEVVKANAEEELVKLFGLIEQHLQQQPFLAGSLPTLADYYLAVILGWDRMLSFDLVERFPELKDYKQRLQQTQTNSQHYYHSSTFITKPAFRFRWLCASSARKKTFFRKKLPTSCNKYHLLSTN